MGTQCWDLHPELIPQAEKEKQAKSEAERLARQQGQQPQTDVGAIINYPPDSNQEELIQRAIGVNSNQVGHLLAQIDVREDREEIIQRIFTRVENKEAEAEVYELGEAQPPVTFKYKKPEEEAIPTR